MMAYLFISIILPASLIFVFSTVILFLNETICNENLVPQVVLALFGRSLGVRRLYVRVLLAIFQVCWISSGVIDILKVSYNVII